MSDRSLRWFALSGPVGAVLLAIGIVLAGSTPSDHASGATVLEHYKDKQGQLLASAFILMIAGALILVFAAYLRARLRDNSPIGDTAALAAFGGGVALAIATFDGVKDTIGLLTAVDAKDPAAASIMNMTGQASWPLITGAAAVFLFGAGLAILRTRVLPRWLGWVALVVGVISILGPGGFLGFFITPFWILVAGILLFRAEPAEGPAPAASGTTPAAA